MPTKFCFAMVLGCCDISTMELESEWLMVDWIEIQGEKVGSG